MPSDSNEPGTLKDITETGAPARSRTGDAQQAWEIARQLETDNEERDVRMTKVQQNIDGNAPMSRAKMRADGRAGDANLNWREGKGQINNAHTPYFDLTVEVPVCIDGDLDTGDASLDTELMRAFAEAFHKMVFGWDGFDMMTQLRDLQMLVHGCGWLVRCNPHDWRWETVLGSNFYVPDGMRIDMTGADHVMFITEMSTGELWRKVDRNAPGWNKKSVNEAIRCAGTGQSADWREAEWQRAFKNGDIHVSSKSSRKVKLYNLFTKEMDGRISHQILDKSATPGKKRDFLYSKVVFEDWNECVCLFPYDIGSDGTIHSVKGLGTEIHAYCDLSNRVNNSFADLLLTGIKPMFQTDNADTQQKLQLVKLGGFNIAPKGWTPMNLNLGSAIAPALTVKQHFESTLTKNTGTFHEEVDAPQVEETAKAAMIRAAGRSKLTKGAHNRYYRSKDREYRENWRVAVNPKLREEMPGGKEAMAFQRECAKIIKRLGAPPDSLQRVENIRATRALGLGSAAMRIEIANSIMEQYPLLDPVGQNNALRMYFAALTSYHSVDGLVPSISTGQLAVEDDSQAADENNAFNILGPEAEVVITPRQQHDIHLNHHVASMERDMQACEQGQQEPRVCQQRLEAKGPHSHEHLNAIMQNPAKAKQVKDFSERLRVLAAYQDHLNQTIAEENAANPQPQEGQPDPDLVKVQGNLELKAQKQAGDQQLKAERMQSDLGLKAQKQQADIALAAHRTGVDTALANAETAADIRRENVKAAQKPVNGNGKK